MEHNKKAVVVWLYTSEKGNSSPHLTQYANYAEAKAAFLDQTKNGSSEGVAAAIFLGEDREDFHPSGHWAEWKHVLVNPLTAEDNTCAVLWHTEEGLQQLFFPDYKAAKAFYKEISPAYAKVLFRVRFFFFLTVFAFSFLFFFLLSFLSLLLFLSFVLFFFRCCFYLLTFSQRKRRGKTFMLMIRGQSGRRPSIIPSPGKGGPWYIGIPKKA